MIIFHIALGHERIKEPELDILDIGLLKVGVVNLAHDAAPTLLRVFQIATLINIISIKVIGTTLFGIERQVEGLNNRRLTIIEFSTGEHLAERYLTGIGVGQSFQVILDIPGSIRRVALCEQAVNTIPGEQSAVLS